MVIVKITPDKEKAKSILKMANTTLEMIESIDINKFPSNVLKEYYEIIRELISILLLLDGIKTYGENAHKEQIEYLEKNYQKITNHEINLIQELRINRNKIAYNGFFVNSDYVTRKKQMILQITNKLKNLIKEKI